MPPLRPLVPFLLLALCTAVSPARAGHKLVEKPQPDDPMQVHVYRLDNGLTVYLTENHEEPRFYAEVAVRAGSKQDPPEATGMAHYMEHMLFKGTDDIGTVDYEAEKAHLDSIAALYEEHFHATDPTQRAAIYAQINQQNQKAAQYAIPNELDRLYSGMGERSLNASTWVDWTVYRVDLPANRLEQWARVEAERFARPVFRLFQTELETVYEEKNRYMDNKDRVLYEAVSRQLYKVHPYRNMTEGSVEHLKNPSLRHMYEFFETWYVPNNMAIAISGDIRIEQAIAVIDSAFSGWVPHDLPKERGYKEPRIRGVDSASVTYPGEEEVVLAFRTVPQTHKDAEACQVLDMILDNRTAGLINLNLTQQQRVREAGSYPLMYNDYGAQYLWGIPKEGQSLEEVQALLLEQVEKLRDGRFEAWIIPAIVRDFEKSYKQRQEANAARVALMRDAFLTFNEWDHARRALERMEKLTKKDIVRVAQKYLGPDYVVGYRRDGQPQIPSIEKPPLDPIQIDASRQSVFAAGTLAMPVQEIEPEYVVPGRDYVQRQMREGVPLYYTYNPLNDLFSFSVTVEVGTLTEKRLKVAAELLDKAGTQRLTPDELKKEWYRLGTDFSVSVGDQETTVSISGLDESFAASLALLAEVLTQPTSTDSTLAELKQIILKRRADAQKDHNTVHQALYQYNRFGEMAPYRRIIPNEQVLALGRQELLDLMGELLSYRSRLSYTGSLWVDQVASALEASYPLDRALRPAPPYTVLQFRQPGQTEIYFYDKEMAQAQVRVEYGDVVPGNPGTARPVTYSEPLTPEVELFNEYFYGGMGGLVFQELREARALAYSAAALYYQGDRAEDQNWMVGVIGTQADKTPEAVAALVELLDFMPASPQRFAAAQVALVNKYRSEHLGFRQVLGAVRQWEKQAVAIDPRPSRLQQLQQADLSRLMAFHMQHVQGRPKLISVTGDKRRIDTEALGRQGRIVELGLTDIFAF
ncbi:MAG: insulinase family protein [Candidatus Latescibacterota bacterium]